MPVLWSQNTVCIKSVYLYPLFSKISEHADGERLRARADLKVRKDAAHRDPSNATLRFNLAFGARRRQAPKGCQK